ncbi:hypothetical protein ACFC9E_13825, partial [Enterococcus faecium]|uniref:hypothetical protein n=1 Tax=Enterococcus faecium TaxID=1352 RepID=UPI0039A4C817
WLDIQYNRVTGNVNKKQPRERLSLGCFFYLCSKNKENIILADNDPNIKTIIIKSTFPTFNQISFFFILLPFLFFK